MALTLARSAGERALVGRQAGKEVLLGLPVFDCEEAVAAMKVNGVAFEGEILDLPYGRQAVCHDCFGNRVSLLERYAEE